MARKGKAPAKPKVYRFVVQSGTPNNLVSKPYEKVGQAREAMLDFFESFHETTRRYGTQDEQKSLIEIKMEVAKRVTEVPGVVFEPQSFRWSFTWGTAPVICVASVTPYGPPGGT